MGGRKIYNGFPDKKRLIVIGNGFDKYLNLDSGFNDFINELFNNDDNMIKEISNQDQQDFLKYFQSIVYESVNDKFDYSFNHSINIELSRLINRYDLNLKEKFNFWIYYLLYIKYTPSISTPTNNWCDIESIIHNFISNNNNFFENNINDLFDIVKKYAVFENIKNINKPNMLNIKNISKQQIRFEDSRNKINIFLLSLIIKSDKSFTEVFLECLKHNVSDDYYHRKLKNSLIRYLMEQVYDFEMRFNDYLKEQTRKINYVEKESIIY